MSKKIDRVQAQLNRKTPKELLSAEEFIRLVGFKSSVPVPKKY